MGLLTPELSVLPLTGGGLGKPDNHHYLIIVENHCKISTD